MNFYKKLFSYISSKLFKMKKLIFLLFIFIYATNTSAQQDEITTYYFIRHAEKDRTYESNKNPHLTEKGVDRALNWAIVFENVKFDLIYSTKYNRTIQTAEPTAKTKELEIQYYNPSHLFDAQFQEKTKGKSVLVVGHSNTTPLFVNDILGEEKYEQIDDNNNSNLYILTISKDIMMDILLKIEH